MFTLASNPSKYTLNIVSSFIYKFVRLFQADALDRLKVITSRQYTSDKEHVMSERFEVDLFNEM